MLKICLENPSNFQITPSIWVICSAVEKSTETDNRISLISQMLLTKTTTLQIKKQIIMKTARMKLDANSVASARLG